MNTTTATIQPYEVLVTLEPASEYREVPSWVATPVWANVDRPVSYSISFGAGPKGEKLARRYQKAALAGAVFYDTQVRTDVDGNTYVGCSMRVMGRHANADLTKLGF